jgi:hypothetical protein
MDFESVVIADHEQRRILEVLAVAKQLLISGGEVVVFAFVFPAEEPFFPNVGEALAAVVGGDVLFEGKRLSGAVCLDGLGVPQKFADVVEVGLRGGALAEGGGFPAIDKIGKGEGHDFDPLYLARQMPIQIMDDENSHVSKIAIRGARCTSYRASTARLIASLARPTTSEEA